MRKITADRNKDVIKKYKELVATESPRSAIATVASEFSIGEFYVKQILKSSGIEVKLRNGSSKTERDAKIFELYMVDPDISKIAENVGLTTTRVGQIIRDGLGSRVKDEVLEKTLDQIKDDVNSGVSHKEIVEKYGQSTIRKVKVNLGYNIFEACIDKRNSQILDMHNEGKTASEIAEAFGLTRDHVYGILGSNGRRRRPTRAEYRERNKKIVESFNAGRTSQELAEEYDMTVTNINIILKNQGVRD